MKSELIMKNSNAKKRIMKRTTQKTRKNKIDYLVGKLFKVHGSYSLHCAKRGLFHEAFLIYI